MGFGTQRNIPCAACFVQTPSRITRVRFYSEEHVEDEDGGPWLQRTEAWCMAMSHPRF